METIIGLEDEKTKEPVTQAVEVVAEAEGKETEPEVLPLPVYCPHCGVDAKLPKFQVLEDDKLEWTRYILSNGKRRFTRTYEVYGGRVKFTLRTRTLPEEKDVDLGIAKAVTDLYSIADFSKVRLELLKLQLVFSLESIEIINTDYVREIQKVNFPLYSIEEIHAAWKRSGSIAFEHLDQVLEQSSTPVMTIILDKLAEFNTLCAALTMQGLSENF